MVSFENWNDSISSHYHRGQYIALCRVVLFPAPLPPASGAKNKTIYRGDVKTVTAVITHVIHIVYCAAVDIGIVI